MVHFGSLAFVLISAGAPSQSTATVHVLGVGNKTCEQWLVAEARRDMAAVENVHWLTGVITGANIIEAATGAGNVTRSGDTVETAEASVHRYCSAHPGDQVSTAAQHLLADMLQRDAAVRRR